MKAIVHIGMPKTGSTSIQAWLNANVDFLSARGAAFDPLRMAEMPKRMTGHQGLAICFRNAIGRPPENPSLKLPLKIHSAEDMTAFAARYEAFMRTSLARLGGDTFVISCEYLGGAVRSADDAAALDRWLSGFFAERRYVVYFRRQEDWIASSYSERIKRGATETLDEVIEKHGVQNWFKRAKNFTDALGDGAIDIRLMEGDFLANGDLIEDFASVIGASAEGSMLPERRNEALSAPAAEILRSVNAAVSHTVADGRRINPAKQQVRRVLLAQKVAAPRIALSGAQIDLVRERNRSSNERLRARFFPDREALFPRRQSAENPRLAPEDVARAAADLALKMSGVEEGARP
ncbi:MAG: hypothetical protein AAFU55_03490 [Pseudomonadota bacterium]